MAIRSVALSLVPDFTLPPGLARVHPPGQAGDRQVRTNLTPGLGGVHLYHEATGKSLQGRKKRNTD